MCEVSRIVSEIVSELVKKLVAEKRIVFTDDDVMHYVEDYFDVECSEDVDLYSEVMQNLNCVTLVDDIGVYMILPRDIGVESLDEKAIVTAYRVLCGDSFTRFATAYVFEKFADAFDFGNEAAWYLLKLVKSYGVEPDEVIDQRDHNTCTGPIYYRFGNTWICECYVYVNYDRHFREYGVFKGREYSFKAPNTESR